MRHRVTRYPGWLAATLLAATSPSLSAAPGGLAWAGFAGGGAGLTPMYLLGFELGPWQDYLAHELTPVYMLEPGDRPIHVSWLDIDEVALMPAFARGLDDDVWWSMSFDQQSVADELTPGFVAGTEPPLYGFHQELFTTGLSGTLPGGEWVSASAVMAYQRFGVAGFGLSANDAWRQSLTSDQWYDPYNESGYGLGVRLAMQQELVEGLSFDAGFQSRIDMEEFGVYRGVYAQPADLDIPARASVGLELQSGAGSWLSFSVERVMYSDLNAFPSRYLPDRFLSLLGDSTSPRFAWDDLTVYTVGWRWSNGIDTEWRVDLSSRTQPEATSSALNAALAGELADNALIIGYSRRTGDRSRLQFNAAYAPGEYAFGGSVLGVTAESLDQDVELEALWTLSF